MGKSYQGLLDHCKKALKDNVQYVYGAKMQVLSYNQIKNLQNTYGKNMVWDSDLNKAGKMCCDCSGLISSYTGIIRSSSGYADTASAEVSISELKAHWKKYVGWALWLKGHIGIVSDTEGYYYAMDGSGRNMVHYPLNKNNWVKVIKLKDIDYEEASEMVDNYDAAVKVLVDKGVISSREYWDNAVKCVKYLDQLVINMANNVK